MLTAAQTQTVGYDDGWGEFFHLTCHEIHDHVKDFMADQPKYGGLGWYDATQQVARVAEYGEGFAAVSRYNIQEETNQAVESDVEWLEQGLDPTMFESLTGQTIEDAVIDHDTFGAVRCAECGEVI